MKINKIIKNFITSIKDGFLKTVVVRLTNKDDFYKTSFVTFTSKIVL